MNVTPHRSVWNVFSTCSHQHSGPVWRFWQVSHILLIRLVRCEPCFWSLRNSTLVPVRDELGAESPARSVRRWKVKVIQKALLGSYRLMSSWGLEVLRSAHEQTGFSRFLHHIFHQEALKVIYIWAFTRETEDSLFLLLNIAQII